MDTDRRTHRLLLAVVTLTGIAALGCAVPASFLAAGTFTPEAIAAIVILGGFAMVATNLEIVVHSELALDSRGTILIASLIVFRQHAVLVGPMIVAALGGVDIALMRQRDWAKIIFSSASDALAMFMAAVGLLAMCGTGDVSVLMLCLGAALSAAVFLSVNSALVSVPISIACHEPYGTALGEVAKFSLQSYPSALLGLGLGWVYLELGIVLVPLLVVPILINRRAFSSYLELKASQEQTIETLILALEAKDPYTSGHARRVAMFSEYVGEELGFGPRRMERLRYAALMHDIGKLIVPNQLLNKPGRLTEAEFERVKRHEPVSVELLSRIDFLAPIAGDTTTEAATAAVKGDSELIEPAIIHVADAFDAMTSTRSYRRALTQETAFTELREGAGTQFNAQCVDALISAIERRGENYGDGFEIDEHDWAVAPPEAGTGSAGLGDFVAEEKAAGR